MNNPVVSNPLLGVALHAVGATFAATCYTPEKRIRGWSWQSYWLTQAAFCWFILPLVVAWLTIPELGAVLREAPTSAMRNAFLLGAAYGIGGTAFGISIRYIGFSLTYAIAVGLSSVLGTLIPPLVKGTLFTTLSRPGAEWIVAGILVGIVGIAGTGIAGRLKEKDLTAASARGSFSLGKGLALSLLAGVLSAVYGFALEAGDPIADVATAHGAGVWRGNVVYVFSNTGAFLTTALYCLFLHVRQGTLREVVALPATAPAGARLSVNWGLAVLTGTFWYGQFFFYNLGHVRMGHYKFTSWAIHMIMLVLISNVVGIVLREWRNCRRLTDQTIAAALVILVGAVLLLTYGNYVGDLAAAIH
ncbi:L-rhamnose/proton symporter RhaT [Opitutus sp. ER46]|uniref:L-rhamnose/proton symporter RhaT n=1 Tax=Opitutus sp. ER46 TaxID=2161864 RepID=UPI000D2F67FF|nr:L-rhamnose/proton symporter RhaT [Opitutus sp. ER46]PTX97755.1 rhamnose:proton symporter [Opitutus sp. ER46]